MVRRPRVLDAGVGVPVGEVVVLDRQRFALITAGAHTGTGALFDEWSRTGETLVGDSHGRSVTESAEPGVSCTCVVVRQDVAMVPTTRRERVGLWSWVGFCAGWLVLAALYWSDGRPGFAIAALVPSLGGFAAALVRFRQAAARERSSVR